MTDDMSFGISSPLATRCAHLRRLSYRQMFLLGGEADMYVETQTASLGEVSRLCRELLSSRGDCPREEALVCLSVLTGLGVTVRDEAVALEALNRAASVLTDLEDGDRLKAHLLIYMYGETEDEAYAEEAERLTSTWVDGTLTKEDAWALDFLRDVRESVGAGYAYPV